MTDLHHTTIATNGIQLHVVTAGPADGPVALLLHGFPECWYGWHHQIGPLAALGYRVVVPDQRGYNTSDKPQRTRSYGIDTLCDDVVGLLDALGVTTATLVAHDWGGAVAWWLAARNPERVQRLVVLNIPHPMVMRRHVLGSLSQARRSWYIGALQLPLLPERALAADDCQRLVRILYANSATRAFTPLDLEVYRAAWTQPGCIKGMVSWYRAVLRHPPAPLPSERVRCPTLLVWGRQDSALGEEMAEPSVGLCDDGRLQFIDEAAHFVQHDAPERVNALLAAFLGPAEARSSDTMTGQEAR